MAPGVLPALLDQLRLPRSDPSPAECCPPASGLAPGHAGVHVPWRELESAVLEFFMLLLELADVHVAEAQVQRSFVAAVEIDH